MTTLDASDSSPSPAQRGSTRTSDVARKFIKRGDETIVQRIRSALGADISRHRPEDLKVIDGLLDDELRQELKGSKRAYESVPTALGCYLGEVFVRNLGARWRVPTLLQALAAFVSTDPFKAERYFYITLGGETVSVFHAAREAVDRTSAVSSLYEFYQRYARAARIAERGVRGVGR